MKIACITDTHFGVKGNNQDFMDVQLKFMDTFIEYLKENDIRHVIHLGDVFDERKSVSTLTINRAKREFFDKMQGHVDKFFWIIGNHDVYYKGRNDVGSHNMVEEYDYVEKVVEVPRYWKPVSDLTVMLVPWITKSNYDTCIEALENGRKEHGATHVFGHFEVKGFEMTKGHKSTSGLSSKLFSDYNEVYSGHFHIPSEQGNINYLGTPYQLTWDDYGSARGFWVFDTETRYMEFVPNMKDNFVMFTYEDDGLSLEDLHQIDYAETFGNAYVKISIKSRQSLEVFDQFRNMVEDVALDVRVIDDVVVDSSIEVEIDEAESTLDIIKSRTRALGNGSEGVENLMVNLYTEAENMAA